MDIPTKQDLIALMEEREGPHVSLYMPTHRAGPETRENPIRFKNLVTRAEEALVESGVRSTEARDMLAPVAALENDHDFWQHQANGLAVFLSEAGLHQFQVPQTLPELVLVEPRFHIKPLLPLLSAGASFHVLAISANRTHLLACTAVSQTEVKVEGMPDGIAEALWSDDPEKQNQFHSFYAGASGDTAMMHGAGGTVPDHKDELLRYFHLVDSALAPYMKRHGGPLVLACVDYLAPLYHEANKYNGLAQAHVSGSPDRVHEDDLRAGAWDLLRPQIDQARDQAIGRYRQLAGTGQTTSDVSEAALAAVSGKNDTVFVTLNLRIWGRVDADAYKVEMHDSQEKGDYDLLDLIAARTLSADGTVYAVEPDSAPEPTGVAAVFRYA